MARILIASRRRAWHWIERGLSTPLFLVPAGIQGRGRSSPALMDSRGLSIRARSAAASLGPGTPGNPGAAGIVRSGRHPVPGTAS
ncbi:MAG: hypothetical protein WBF88_02375, partial [Pusillimonas sp.]